MVHLGALAAEPADKGVRAELEFTPDHVVIVSDPDVFRWRWDEVRIAPWDTTTVRLELPDGQFFYRADDPLRFADALDRATSEAADASNPGHWWESVFGAPRRAPHPASLEAATSPPSAAPSRQVAARASFTERAAAIDLTHVPAEEPGPHAARSARRWRLRPFGRPREHTHRWSQNTVNGGIVRRVCDECRQVSIDLRGSGAVSAG